MFMHVNARKITFLGLLLAINVSLLVLGGIIETSTLFFIAAGAFCVGIVVREYGIIWGGSYLAAGVLLGFMLAPNKIYCITYLIMSLYILLSEIVWLLLCKRQGLQNNLNIANVIFWILRYIIFNILYIPLLFLIPSLFFSENVSTGLLAAAIAVGQLGLLLFEKGYCYFQAKIWSRFRKLLDLS